MTDLRTVLRWLGEQEISELAECWILSDGTVEPVVTLQELDGSLYLGSRSVWSAPAPVPLRFGTVYDKLLGSYSGGGLLHWTSHPGHTYRGSYVVNPNNAVFFLFLPDSIKLIDSHSDKMEQRKEQAKQLTKEIENPWQT